MWSSRFGNEHSAKKLQCIKNRAIKDLLDTLVGQEIRLLFFLLFQIARLYRLVKLYLSSFVPSIGQPFDLGHWCTCKRVVTYACTISVFLESSTSGECKHDRILLCMS